MATKKVSKAKVSKVKTATKKIPVKVVKLEKPKYELISFSIKATIPTQQYGNMMPEIAIKARNIEEAQFIVLPFIEELYSKYAERPRDGSVISFLSINKASVTVEEKKVDVPAPVKKEPVIEKEEKKEGVLAKSADAVEDKKTPQEKVEALADELSPKSPAYAKAAGAIKGATSLNALNLIEEQIHKSVKLTAEEKPMLLTEVLLKRKTFA